MSNRSTDSVGCTHLAMIPRRSPHSQDPVLDGTRTEVVEHDVVRDGEDRVIVPSSHEFHGGATGGCRCRRGELGRPTGDERARGARAYYPRSTR